MDEYQRRKVQRQVMRTGIGFHGIRPGDPEFIARARLFSPLEVHLGYMQGEAGQSTSVSWWPGKGTNPFLLVLGTAGSGKTSALEKIAFEISNNAFPLLVVDFHGVLGEVPNLRTFQLTAANDGKVGINPLSVDPNYVSMMGFQVFVERLVETITRAYPRLGSSQSGVIRKALFEAYKRKGFHEEWSATWGNTPPMLKDVLDILTEYSTTPPGGVEKSAANSCINIVGAVFGSPIYRRKRNISVDDLLVGNVRLDLHRLDAASKAFIADLLLRNVYSALLAKGPAQVGSGGDADKLRLMVLVDEAKIIGMGKVKKDNSDNILNLIATEGRKYGFGLVLASQRRDHFGEDVLSCMGAILVMKAMDERDAAKNAVGLGVSADDVGGLAAGSGFFRSRDSSQTLRVDIELMRK